MLMRHIKGHKLMTALPVYLLILMAGCSANKALLKDKSPEELYQKGMALYYKKSYSKAIDSFQEIVNSHPLSRYSAEARLLIADSYYYDGKYGLAYSYYTDFVNLYPTHYKAPYALFQKGMSAYNQIETMDRDQENTKNALITFEELSRLYPDTAYADKARVLISNCRKRLAEREFYVGSFYYKTKNFKGAIKRLKGLVDTYPDSGLIDRSLLLLGLSYLNMGDKDKARDVLTRLIRDYPESRYSRDAKKRLDKI